MEIQKGGSSLNTRHCMRKEENPLDDQQRGIGVLCRAGNAILMHR